MPKDEIKVQTMMLARDVVVLCPYCNQTQDGFFGNPAGAEVECCDCNKTFQIHKDADIEHA